MIDQAFAWVVVVVLFSVCAVIYELRSRQRAADVKRANDTTSQELDAAYLRGYRDGVASMLIVPPAMQIVKPPANDVTLRDWSRRDDAKLQPWIDPEV